MLLVNIEQLEGKANIHQKGERTWAKSKLLSTPLMRKSILVAACERTHNDMHNSNFDINYSGTTACTVLLAGDLLTCTNVGDSRAILCSVPEPTSKKMEITALSIDHKPNSKGEYERITMSNGRVDSYRGKNGVSKI